MKVTRDQLLDHLRVITDGVQSGDTLEGSIQFSAVDADTWDVEGAYRIGNLQGQGGLRILPTSDLESEDVTP